MSYERATSIDRAQPERDLRGNGSPRSTIVTEASDHVLSYVQTVASAAVQLIASQRSRARPARWNSTGLRPGAPGWPLKVAFQP